MTGQMLADLPVETLENANRSFQACFETARKSGALDQLASECFDLLAANPSEFAAPYAFAIAARARLHDPVFWSKSSTPASGQLWRPKLDLLEWLDKLLSMPAAVNSRHNYYFEMIAGVRNFIVGDMNAAFRYFALAARPPDFHRVVRDDFGHIAGFARTFPSLADLAAARGRRFDRELNFICRPQGQWIAAISISVDVIYAEAFVHRWIDSLSRAGVDRVVLHLHVMFRGGADEILLGNFITKARECRTPLAISIEESVRADRAYFASARFLKARAILDAFGCAVLFCDADSYITDAVAFADRHVPTILKEQHVLGFIPDGPYNGYLAWRCFGASWIVVPSAEWAKRFLSLVGDAVEYFFAPRGANWWIDQTALEVARNLAITEGIPASKFQPVRSVLPGMLKTGEAYKIETISKVPRIKALLDTGLTYWQALSRADSQQMSS